MDSGFQTISACSSVNCAFYTEWCSPQVFAVSTRPQTLERFWPVKKIFIEDEKGRSSINEGDPVQYRGEL